MSYTPPPSTSVPVELIESVSAPAYTPPASTSVVMDFVVDTSSGGSGGVSNTFRKVNFLFFA
jgi:hypothetical protein